MPSASLDRWSKWTPEMAHDTSIIVDYKNPGGTFVRWHRQWSTQRRYDADVGGADDDEDWGIAGGGGVGGGGNKHSRQAKSQRRDKKGRFAKGFKGQPAISQHGRGNGMKIDRHRNYHDAKGRFAGKAK